MGNGMEGLDAYMRGKGHRGSRTVNEMLLGRDHTHEKAVTQKTI